MANRRVRLMLLRLFLHRRVEIDPTSPESWNLDASTLVSKLELQVGKDLQYVASMEPWSAGSSDFLFSPQQGGSNRFR